MLRWRVARQLGRRIGWEGDFRGPISCPLPNGDCGGEYLIAWKQDNNGATFVASPFALLWLQREANGWTKGEYRDDEEVHHAEHDPIDAA